MNQPQQARRSYVVNDQLGEFELPILSDLIGVKYRYKGRDPNIGLDCLGLIMVASKRLFGIEIHELVDYPEDWASNGLNLYRENWDKVFDRRTTITPGDVLLFQFGSPVPNHAGVYAGEQKVIHCHQDLNVSYGNLTRFGKYVVLGGRPLKQQLTSLRR